MNALYTSGHRFLLPGILLIVLLVLGACGGQATPPPAAEPTQVLAAAEPTQAPATEPTQALAAAEPTQAPAAAEPTQPTLPERATVPAQLDNAAKDSDAGNTNGAPPPIIVGGLRDFDSYRYTLTISFDGVNEADEERQGSVSITQEVINDTNDQRIQFEVTGMETDTDELNNMDMYQIGNTLYLRATGGTLGDQCLRFQSDETMPNPAEEFNIGDVISDIENAKLVEKGVEMNGFMTDRYEIGEESFSDVAEEVDSASGDIWVDQETGHLIKFSGEFVGRSEIEGEQIDGTFFWEYSLEEVDTITEIKLPKECENARDLTNLDLDIEGTQSDSK